MPINFDKAFGLHDDALLLYERRTQLLAENIANADTPNYKARDIDFEAALRQANNQSTSSQSVGLTTTHAGHMNLAADALAEQTQYRVPEQSAADGNTVDVQKEKTAFAENTVRYQTTFTILSRRISGLMTAFRGE